MGTITPRKNSIAYGILETSLTIIAQISIAVFSIMLITIFVIKKGIGK